MLVLDGDPQNPTLLDINRRRDFVGYIRTAHNAPVQLTHDVWTIYHSFPKLILLNMGLIHYLDLYKNFEHVDIRAPSIGEAIAAMREKLKDEYYIVHELSVSNHGMVRLTLVDIKDVYLSGQPLQFFRYNIIDEMLRTL